MASLHEQQSCCWIADKAAPVEAEYYWRSGVFRPCVIPSAGLACARLSPARFYSRVIVAPVVRFRRMVLGMVTLLVLLR